MDNTAIQPSVPSRPLPAPPPPPVLPPVGRAAPQTRSAWEVAKTILKPIASLRLTVILFVLSMVLIFFGTVAQIDEGIWTVVKKYFRSFGVLIPFQLLVQFGQKFFGVSDSVRVPGSFPFPGGWTLGGLLLVNVLAAHLVRFRLSWNRSGILILHSGLILLFAGEIVTGLFAVEGQMQIREGQSANFVVHTRLCELAVIDPSDPKADDVVVIAEKLLRKGGTISHPDLPFDVEVKRYLVNSVLKRSPGEGPGLAAVEPPEGSGSEDMPAVYLTLRDKKDGMVLAEDYLGSVHLEPVRDRDDGSYYAVVTVAGEKRRTAVPYAPVKVDGKDYEVALRFKRTYKPYSIHLIDFRFDRYMGTNKAKNFSSEVRLIDPERNDDRTVVIRMNEPLMHRGDALYQSSFDAETEDVTVLLVVRDPGKPLQWLSINYLGCIVVSLGMLIQFGISLHGFLQRRAAL
jgi:hypothetical protein